MLPGREFAKNVIEIFLALIFLVLVLACAIFASQNFKKDHDGINAEIIGTISDKQFIPAHTTTSGCLLSFSSDYHPDEYKFTIRRYDKNKKLWESASIDVDKGTYNKYAVNSEYKDSSGKTTFFFFDQDSPG